MIERSAALGNSHERKWTQLDARLARSPLTEIQRNQVHKAFLISNEAHGNQRRLSGEAYFTHLFITTDLVLSVALIDPNIKKSPSRITTLLCASFLHDSLEDTEYFAIHRKGETYKEWEIMGAGKIAKDFSLEVANIVVSLTEPVVAIDGKTIVDKKMAKSKGKELQHQRLSEGAPEALLIKMADRLHNLMTFYPTADRPNPERKIRDTEEELFPIFSRAMETYPVAAGLLMNLLHEAILDLRAQGS